MEDEFVLDGYSRDRIYHSSRDGKGFSEHLPRTKVPTGLLGLLSRLRGTGNLPHRTDGEFVRDAVIHHVHFWQQKLDADETQAQFAEVLLLADLERIHTEKQLNEAMVAQAIDRLKDADTETERASVRAAIRKWLPGVKDRAYRDRLQTILDHGPYPNSKPEA